jgi:primosomal replication protein N''
MSPDDTSLVRRCPACSTERPAAELTCEYVCSDGASCHWDLTGEPIYQRGSDPVAHASATQPQPLPQCRNGHAMGEGDELCLICGADRQDAAPAVDTPATETIVAGWRLLRRQAALVPDARFESFIAQHESGGPEVSLVLYQHGAEPDPAVYEVLRKLPPDHIPVLLETGRHQDSTFEVSERIDGKTLQEVGYLAAGRPELLRLLITELAEALASLSQWGLRHRDLHPGNIRLRSLDPLDFVITGFGSARLSDFDLEAVAPLELTRYSAPEAIVGAVSAASDWWSLGMILLEQATEGRCFLDVNDQAFRLHIVTRGITLPDNLPSDLRLLLRGLLARDPLSRWSSPEVRAWLAGEPVEAPAELRGEGEEAGAAPIMLAGQRYTRPAAFALAAAEATHWEEGRDLVLRGSVATWLDVIQANCQRVAELRRVMADASIDADFRYGLALMVLNEALPLTMRGEIVTPNWLLTHPADGYVLITSAIMDHLERMGREIWLVRMGLRVAAVRERAALLEIALDEDHLRVAVLASSRAALEAEREALGRVYPDSDHLGMATILDRSQLSEEDLILLVSASKDQYVALATIVDAALQLAAQVGVPLDTTTASRLLAMSRRKIFTLVDERISNFARCGIERIDDWADAFRVEHRMPLPRAAVLLGVPREQWQPPPKQKYVKTLLEHFEKRVAGSVARGPLVKFVIGKTTPRVDLFELGTAATTAESLLNHVLTGDEAPRLIDPTSYAANEVLDSRLRRLVSHASTFRRDTGLDGRTLGFPFLMIAESRGASSRSNPSMKLAPILLWPVTIELQFGSGLRAATLAFDGERKEVRLNPALEGLVGPARFVQWQKAHRALLARSSIKIGDVIDVFGALAAPRSRSLVRLPASAPARGTAVIDLIPAATLFNAEFTGQSVSADLRDIGRRSVSDTALDVMIRVSDTSPVPRDLPAVSESHNYSVIASDPSQEIAVGRSRIAPGLLVEGPPGTGKSQTIVNVVSDAIGRGETVLVVCQKQAALKVVKKRLDAERLAERSFLIVDTTKDREMVIRSLRDQLVAVRNEPEERAPNLLRRRDEKAARIAALERDVDQYHSALHATEPTTGVSYRQLLGRLMQVKAEGAVLDIAALRGLLGGLDPGSLSTVEDACAPLAALWLAAAYENSALTVLRPFAADETVAADVASSFASYVAAEEARFSALAAHPDAFDTDTPQPCLDWLDAHRPLFLSMTEADRQALAKRFPLFKQSGPGTTTGSNVIAMARECLAALAAIPRKAHDAALFAPISALSPITLRQHLADACEATATPGFLDHLNPFRWKRVRRIRTVLAALGESSDATRMQEFRNALALEVTLRPLRQRVDQLRALLGVSAPVAQLPIELLESELRGQLAQLETVANAAAAVLECPRIVDAEAMVIGASPAAFERLEIRFLGAMARHAARQASLARLNALSEWFPRDWLSHQAGTIISRPPELEALRPIVKALPTLEPYQRFRLRASTLPPKAIEAFAILSRSTAALRVVPMPELEGVVRRTLRYAAYLAWKARIEEAHPALFLEHAEIERKVAQLAELDRELLALNRDVLHFGVQSSRLAPLRDWDNITRLTGPRARRLREIIDQGGELGLMHLRPVWLMNPDVASRILPLKAGLFDIVIYDEASQMLVEHSLPTLFRAKRVLIAGDEKQMPPSSFFATRIDGDDDGAAEYDFMDDAATEAERLAKAEAWNRREVKDCPDLLQLGRSVLPISRLQIHYRSKYRELIAFSNSAYYQGDLNVPARHPDTEVNRVRPIEVVRINGVYEDQSNEDEAEAVVGLLAELWAGGSATPPSVGVVTFNRKQADCIEEAIVLRAGNDPGFAASFERERDREQNGEDMSFFVKNVENVQGDERDIIIFSTTFGRDRRGTFRRNFGVLSQTGGERRLNVAVTRARHKVVLVTSMPVADVSDWLSSGRQANKPRDYLQAYLHYAEQVSSGALEAARAATSKMSPAPPVRLAQAAAGDGFTESVRDFVQRLGFTPITATDGDAFGLDLAIEDPRTKLFGIGIECDAPRHPLLERARAREIWRPTILKRAIGSVHRVSSHAWFHRPGDEQARLSRAIQAAIVPGAQS